MIDFDEAISIIRRNGGFKPNRKDTSYYRTYTIEGNRPLQARISNHGTWLWTWYDKDYDPSYAINFCIVFGNNIEIAPTLSQIRVTVLQSKKQGTWIVISTGFRKKSFQIFVCLKINLYLCN